MFSKGGTAVDSAGSNFTPHTIAIQTGEVTFDTTIYLTVHVCVSIIAY